MYSERKRYNTLKSKKSTLEVLRISPTVPFMFRGPAICLADTVGTVTAISVVVVLLGLLVVVVSTSVGDADIVDTGGGGVGDGARVTVVGVDTWLGIEVSATVRLRAGDVSGMFTYRRWSFRRWRWSQSR